MVLTMFVKVNVHDTNKELRAKKDRRQPALVICSLN